MHLQNDQLSSLPPFCLVVSALFMLMLFVWRAGKVLLSFKQPNEAVVILTALALFEIR